MILYEQNPLDALLWAGVLLFICILGIAYLSELARSARLEARCNEMRKAIYDEAKQAGKEALKKAAIEDMERKMRQAQNQRVFIHFGPEIAQ